MCRRLRLPIRQQLWFELAGAQMPLKCLFNCLKHERDLGLLPWIARAVKLLLPVHQGQQHLLSPLAPRPVSRTCPRRQHQWRQVLTDRLPPKVDEGRDAAKLLLDFAQGVFLQRQSVGLKRPATSLCTLRRWRYRQRRNTRYPVPG